VLLAFAWWRRGRIDRQDVFRTIPFFLLALVMGLMTLWRQTSGTGVPGDAAADGLLSRIAAGAL
jgi:hypothetical protein